MTVVLAIDPGPVRSAWLVLDTRAPALRRFGIDDNAVLLDGLRFPLGSGMGADVVVIEWVESFGMAVGREVFETIHWSGRFTEAIERMSGNRVVQLPRRAVKLHLCGSARAKDPNIRQVLIDRFGGSAARGTKKSPGPLYGVSNDLWSALALAVTYDEQLTDRVAR